MRIDSLSYSNVRTQGAQQREVLRQRSPQHLEQCATLILHTLESRQYSTSPAVLVLGAGACTEVPLVELARASDDVVLADLDLPSMQQARGELISAALRKHVHLVESDITGGVSHRLNSMLEKQPWSTLVPQGAQAVFDAAATCLEQCPVPDPPELDSIGTGAYGLVISALVLSQLFSYPLLDILDHIQRLAPQLLSEQERHHRYQEAAQAFRKRVISAHLHLLRKAVDVGGFVVLLSDIRGFVFNVYGTASDAAHRRTLPLVPRTLPDIIGNNFTIQEEAHWEWLTDLPTKDKPGRGYEVVGYVLVCDNRELS
ncbi:MAG: hypothetical protein NVSMB27_23200 [Ktedonobacteraceae bacterium]